MLPHAEVVCHHNALLIPLESLRKPLSDEIRFRIAAETPLRTNLGPSLSPVV
jgi:hypothetical protein